MENQLTNFITMKKMYLIVNCLILFFSITATAQFNNGRNDTRNNGTNSELENERRKEDYEKEKMKNIEKSIEKLKNDLQLDELQAIAVKKIILGSIKHEGVIIKKEENDEDKMKSLQSLSETTDTKIISFLNPAQKIKFIELKENLKKKKK